MPGSRPCLVNGTPLRRSMFESVQNKKRRKAGTQTDVTIIINIILYMGCWSVSSKCPCAESMSLCLSVDGSVVLQPGRGCWDVRCSALVLMIQQTGLKQEMQGNAANRLAWNNRARLGLSAHIRHTGRTPVHPVHNRGCCGCHFCSFSL